MCAPFTRGAAVRVRNIRKMECMGGKREKGEMVVGYGCPGIMEHNNFKLLRIGSVVKV